MVKTLSRRSLFGRGGRKFPDFFPPWTTGHRIAQDCRGCGDCVAACPQDILSLIGGKAGLVPGQDECIFCGACADSCPEESLFQTDQVPWVLTAHVQDSCLLKAGIDCRLCTDSCLERALVFDLRVRPVGAVTVDNDLCTGCGACLGVCPNQSLYLHEKPQSQSTGIQNIPDPSHLTRCTPEQEEHPYAKR